MTTEPGHPIVVFGDDWGRHVSSMQHVFRHIIDRRPVVWVNAIGHRVPEIRLSDVRRAASKIGRALGGSPPTSPGRRNGPKPAATIEPRVLPWHHWKAVHAVNTSSLLRAIRRTLADGGWTKPPILVTGSPPSVGVVGKLGEIRSVYFCMDDFLHLPGVTASMIAPLERRLLERVDLVVATARRLTEIKRPASGAVEYLPQGVNYGHFAEPKDVPDELARLPRPLIGFAGGLSDCCDFELIRHVALAHPEGSVVLVGPTTVASADELDPIQLPNVHRLGPRPYEELPAYVQAFDVGIIPYVLNDWTRAVDPLKLLEYLAAGIPVVTTDIPEVWKYQDAVAIADDPPAFLAAVAEALAQATPGDRAARQAVASEQDWAARAATFLDLIERPRSATPPAVRASG